MAGRRPAADHGGSRAEDPRGEDGGVLRVVDADAARPGRRAASARSRAARRARRGRSSTSAAGRRSPAGRCAPRRRPAAPRPGRRPRSARAARAPAPRARTRRPRRVAVRRAHLELAARSRARRARRARAASARGRTPSRQDADEGLLSCDMASAAARCRDGSARRGTRSARPPRRPAPRASASVVADAPVTARIRPPFVTSCSAVARRAGVEDERARRPRASCDAVDRRARVAARSG